MNDSLAATTLATPRSRRRPALLAATGAFLLLGAAAALYELVTHGRYVETDDAYVDVQPVVVTALIPAPVLRVNVVDTQTVTAGDTLMVLDDADLRLSRQLAEAQLAMTRRKVSTYYDAHTSLTEQRDLAAATLNEANAAVVRAEGAAKTGASGSQEALAQAVNVAKAAKAQLLAAAGQTTANADLVNHATLRDHPEVVAAETQVEQADLGLTRTVIKAPVSGIVAKTDVNAGQLVMPGAPLMELIPIDAAYASANFKEAQLRHVRIGQQAVLTSDLYGTSVKFHGTVAGLAGGTGSTLALIPTQNATGNWVKVVQRLPVRIALNTSELKVHPLRLGMTLTARIDTRGN